MTRYRLGTIIGTGGMAVVRRAWRLRQGHEPQPVAVKQLLAQHARDPAMRACFEQEAELHLGLPHHPNLLRALAFERKLHGRPALTLERIDGGSLHEAAAGERLPAEVVRAVLLAVLEALAFLHGHDVLHRDVSPGNILFTRKGAIKLADLGVARQIGMSSIVPGFKGTPATASPEAMLGHPMGPSSDLYSLAAVAFLCLTGEPPFGHGQRFQLELRMMHWNIAPLPPDCPDDLRELLSGLLQPARRRRYHSAAAVLAELRHGGRPVADAACIAALAERAHAARAQASAVRPSAAPSAEIRAAAPPPRGDEAPPDVLGAGTSVASGRRGSLLVLAAAALLVGAVGGLGAARWISARVPAHAGIEPATPALGERCAADERRHSVAVVMPEPADSSPAPGPGPFAVRVADPAPAPQQPVRIGPRRPAAYRPIPWPAPWEEHWLSR